MHRRRLLSIVGAGLVTALSGCASGSDGDPGSGTSELPTDFDDGAYAAGFTPHGPWEMVGHDPRRTGHNATSALPVGDTGAAWLRWLGEDGGSPTAPVADDRTVYVGYTAPRGDRREFRGVVTALDGRTGTERWSTLLTPPSEARGELEGVRPGGLVRTGANLYVAASVPDTGRSRIVALDATDGAVTWQRTIPGVLSAAPGRGDGAVFVPVAGHGGGGGVDPVDDALYAYDLDGTERWRCPLDDAVVQPVAFVGAVVYAGLADGRVVAVDATDGTSPWERSVVDHEPGAGVPIQEPPAIDDARLYVTGSDRTLYAISRDGGSPVWSVTLQDVRDGWRAAPALFEETVYAGAARGGLYALDAADGSVRWQAEDAPVSEQIAVTDRGVVSAWRGTVGAFDHGGDARWTFEMPVGEAPGDAGYGMAPTVMVAHDLAYVRLVDGRLYAIGSRAWHDDRFAVRASCRSPAENDRPYRYRGWRQPRASSRSSTQASMPGPSESDAITGPPSSSPSLRSATAITYRSAQW